MDAVRRVFSVVQIMAIRALWRCTLPPLNPENDVTVYIVVQDFGDLGRAFGAGGRRKPR
jgi:hypothetical protein